MAGRTAEPPSLRASPIAMPLHQRFRGDEIGGRVQVEKGIERVSGPHRNGQRITVEKTGNLAAALVDENRAERMPQRNGPQGDRRMASISRCGAGQNRSRPVTLRRQSLQRDRGGREGGIDGRGNGVHGVWAVPREPVQPCQDPTQWAELSGRVVLDHRHSVVRKARTQRFAGSIPVLRTAVPISL